MRHVLDQDFSWRRMERTIENPERTQTKMPGETMHEPTRVLGELLED